MKSYTLNLIFSILLIAGLTACTAIQRTVTIGTIDIVSKASVLKGQYEIVTQIIEKHRDSFSEEELQEFLHIDQNAKTVYTKIKDVIDIENFDITPQEIEYLYEASKDSYIRAKSLIEKYEGQFSPYEITQLRMFDVQLQEMDKSIKKLLENPETMDTRKTLTTILQVASLSLKVILPLVL
jgi:hypothetical protein